MSEELRRLQLAELDILKETLKLAEAHRLTYYILGGTLLGAVRHQGFIPWDDDIDTGTRCRQGPGNTVIIMRG